MFFFFTYKGIKYFYYQQYDVVILFFRFWMKQNLLKERTAKIWVIKEKIPTANQISMILISVTFKSFNSKTGRCLKLEISSIIRKLMFKLQECRTSNKRIVETVCTKYLVQRAKRPTSTIISYRLFYFIEFTSNPIVQFRFINSKKLLAQYHIIATSDILYNIYHSKWTPCSSIPT